LSAGCLYPADIIVHVARVYRPRKRDFPKGYRFARMQRNDRI